MDVSAKILSRIRFQASLATLCDEARVLQVSYAYGVNRLHCSNTATATLSSPGGDGMTIHIVTVPYRYDEKMDGLGRGPVALLKS